jgi:FlaA1/EpsC-like NDP-sugar epimerase
MEPGPTERTERTTRAGRQLRCALRQLKWALLLLPVFVGSYYFSYWLRFEGQMSHARMQVFSSTVVYVVLIKLASFGWFRVYQGCGRLVTFYDLVALVKAATGSLLVTVLLDRFLVSTHTIPRSVFLLDWGATIVLIGGIRALLRATREHNRSLFVSGDRLPAFIVGANDAGEALLRTMIRSGESTYQVVGFLDDDDRRQGTRIGGVPVIGKSYQICPLAERHGVHDVLIAAGSLSGKQVRQLVEQARRHSICVKVLPSYEQLINGKLEIRARPVLIDDLLSREPIQLEMDDLCQWIDNRVLLVTGSAGSIGAEISRQLLQFSPKKIILCDRNENGQFFLERELRPFAQKAELEVCIADILDERRMRGVLEEHRPDIIFHAAAYKHVPLMEAHPGEAAKNIVFATKQLADLAILADVRSFVLISTDKAVNPTSVMGACKRAAELYVQSLAEVSSCRFVTVRFGNVLDSAGSVVQVFNQQIADGGPVTVTDKRMYRYFMTIPEAARLVIQAGAIGEAGEILLLDMGDPVRIVDLAAEMVRLSGLRVGEDVEIEIVGMRPGEKLVEQLCASGETLRPTRHPKILVAEQARRDPAAILRWVEQLQNLADEQPSLVVRQLRRIVPEYIEEECEETLDRRVAA